MSTSGGQLITRILQAHEVGTVFALAGASHTHLLDPLDQAGMAIVSNRHEAGAVGAADGYSRSTGKTGVALIVADQGLPNAIGALAVAWHALSPVVVLVATPPRVFVEAEAGIDQDKLALVAPLSKWARTVPDVSRLGDYLESAIKHARSGRPGPVVLLIPENILQAEVSAPMVTPWTSPLRAHPDPASIEQAADLISQSKRPLIVAGGGAAWAGASEALSRISTRFGIPVFMNSLGRGVVAEDEVLGFPWPYAQVAACDADVVIIVGARLTQRLGLGLPPRFSETAKFIQIDCDAGAFHRNRRTDVPILADAAVAMEQLDLALHSRLQPQAFNADWVSDALKPRKKRIAEILAASSESVHPLQLASAINDRLPRGSRVLADGADIATWMYGGIRIHQPRGFMDHYPMGAMGSCTALAIGVAAAAKEQLGDRAPPTVLISGDGAIGFHPAELHSAVLADLNLKVIIGNDGAWGTELHGQKQAIGRDINTQLGQLSYEKLADVFGGRGLRIESLEEMPCKLDLAFQEEGLVIVNVLIDPEAGKELKHNADVRMILFSDILSGQADLGKFSGGLL